MREAFEQAVADYRLTALDLPDEALAIAADSFERTGLFLLGEIHGVAQTPLAILELVNRLDIGTLAFEWSHDELDDVVQPVLSTGRFDLDALWALPPSAEVFSGDGRLTAGHVRLLEHLSGRLDRIVLLDRVGSEGQEREDGMARRLLDSLEPRTLAILGAGHIVREPVDELAPLGLLVETALPGVANGVLAPSGGTCWFHGERAVSPDAPAVDTLISVGRAEPAAVP